MYTRLLYNRLILENCRADDNELEILTGTADIDLVRFSVSINNIGKLHISPVKDEFESKYFFLNKAQVGILIAYLQEIHKHMDNDR